MDAATRGHKISWSAIALAAVAAAAYAGATLLVPALRPPFMKDLFDVRPLAIGAHVAGGAVALVMGAFQVNAHFRKSHPAVHRFMGRIYIASVLISGAGGLALAVRSTGGLVGHAGFGMMAVLWLLTTLLAWKHILNRDFIAHRVWMLRSYALTLAAVTLRIYLPLSQFAGISFSDAYPAIAWLCWVPNLLFVEWFIISHPLLPPDPRQAR